MKSKKLLKIKKLLKECPILTGITLIAVLLTVVSLVFRSTVYAGYAGEDVFGRHPALAMALQGARDNVFPWSSVAADDGEVPVDAEPDMESEISDDPSSDGEEADTSDVTGEDDAGSAPEGENPDDLSESSWDISGNDAEEQIVYEFTEVDDDYFSDALFIGDSRTVDVHVKRLREKLEGVSNKWTIKTVWGIGYKFELLQ